MRRKKIIHLDQNHICFENDSVLCCVNESTDFWRNVNVDTLNIAPKRMFPFRLKPIYNRDDGFYYIPKQPDKKLLSWKDTYYSSIVKEDNQSYSCVEYNSDSTLFIIVNPNDVHISRTNGILDELYNQCLF